MALVRPRALRGALDDRHGDRFRGVFFVPVHASGSGGVRRRPTLTRRRGGRRREIHRRALDDEPPRTRRGPLGVARVVVRDGGEGPGVRDEGLLAVALARGEGLVPRGLAAVVDPVDTRALVAKPVDEHHLRGVPRLARAQPELAEARVAHGVASALALPPREAVPEHGVLGGVGAEGARGRARGAAPSRTRARAPSDVEQAASAGERARETGPEGAREARRAGGNRARRRRGRAREHRVGARGGVGARAGGGEYERSPRTCRGTNVSSPLKKNPTESPRFLLPPELLSKVLKHSCLTLSWLRTTLPGSPRRPSLTSVTSRARTGSYSRGPPASPRTSGYGSPAALPARASPRAPPGRPR